MRIEIYEEETYEDEKLAAWNDLEKTEGFYSGSPLNVWSWGEKKNLIFY